MLCVIVECYDVPPRLTGAVLQGRCPALREGRGVLEKATRIGRAFHGTMRVMDLTTLKGATMCTHACVCVCVCVCLRVCECPPSLSAGAMMNGRAPKPPSPNVTGWAITRHVPQCMRDSYPILPDACPTHVRRVPRCIDDVYVVGMLAHAKRFT